MRRNRIEDRTSPDLVMVIESAYVLTPQLNPHVLPIVFTNKCRVPS